MLEANDKIRNSLGFGLKKSCDIVTDEKSCFKSKVKKIWKQKHTFVRYVFSESCVDGNWAAKKNKTSNSMLSENRTSTQLVYLIAKGRCWTTSTYENVTSHWTKTCLLIIKMLNRVRDIFLSSKIQHKQQDLVLF